MLFIAVLLRAPAWLQSCRVPGKAQGWEREKGVPLGWALLTSAVSARGDGGTWGHRARRGAAMSPSVCHWADMSPAILSGSFPWRCAERSSTGQLTKESHGDVVDLPAGW